MFHKKFFRYLLISLVLLLALGAGGTYFWLLRGLPPVDSLNQHLITPSVRITDRNGKLLYEMLPDEGSRHTAVSLEEIPLYLRQATIATEDRNFYSNPGVDLPAILRSLWNYLRGGETLAGGSTITQQVARNLLLEQERGQRTLQRKLREAVLAWQITRRYSKDQVLALYLNQMPYGGVTYGVEAAAQTYFGKSVSQLDLAECALLAGLPQAPGLYDPFSNLEGARQRQSVVLGLMVKAGYISSDQRQLAENERLALTGTPYPMQAPHFVMMVRSQLADLLSPEELASGSGWTVRTTLDLDAQHTAESAVTNQLERLRAQTDDPLGHNVNDAAVVVLDPHSGEILAMVGSPDYYDVPHAGAINMALAPRQPGSALKPLIYADAFDPTRPDSWTPATMLLDVTTHFTTHDGRPYTPVNYDGREHGPVLVREALGSSLNVPAVIALDHIGLADLFSFASKLGITSLGDPNQADLSVALGGGEVRLIDLTAAYGAFASGGYRVKPFAILDVTDGQGSLRYQAQPAPGERVLDGRVAWLISDMLSDDDARLIGFGANSVLRLDRPAAVKTGTTTNFHDNWTIGYTPNLVVGVWAGNATHEAMRNVTGLTGAAPIWAQVMRSLLVGQPEQSFTRPDGLVQVEVCALSGLLPTPACPYRKLEWFIDGTQPTASDTFYKVVTIDSQSGRLASDATPPERRVQETVLDLPPQAQGWARGQELALLSDLLPPADETQPGASPEGEAGRLPLWLASPAANAVYHLSSELPADMQQLHLEALGTAGLDQVTLWVDGQQVTASSAPPYEGWWQLAPGKHEAWAVGVSASGQRLESPHVPFEVK